MSVLGVGFWELGVDYQVSSLTPDGSDAFTIHCLTPSSYQVSSALMRASRPVRIEFGCSHVPPGTNALL